MPKAIEKRRLQFLELPRQQGGYFTAAQAAASGFDNANQFRYVGDGRWERVRRGIFRLASEPISPQADFHIISRESAEHKARLSLGDGRDVALESPKQAFMQGGDVRLEEKTGCLT